MQREHPSELRSIRVRGQLETIWRVRLEGRSVIVGNQWFRRSVLSVTGLAGEHREVE